MSTPVLRSPAALFAAGLILVPAAAAQPALTIYNQNFAVVRQTVPLDLQPGGNTVAFPGVTLQVEPDSVVLRDPAGRVAFNVLEQSYRADTISEGLMLSLFEGQTIDFLVRDQDGKEYPVPGRIIRSGYVPGPGGPRPLGGPSYQQPAIPPEARTPIIEVDGKLRFSLPGQPIFPALANDAILQPTLTWQLAAERAAKFDAELSYLTGGLSWEASYNLVAPEKGDTMDLVGWVTISNQSGKQFDAAVIKLMAGDVNKLQPEDVMEYRARTEMMVAAARAPQVTEKAFDEFHLYSLPRPTTLRNRETKQVEFVRATGLKTTTFYVYNGADIGPQYRGWNPEMIRNNPDYGAQSNPKVWVMREFVNSEANQLGVPLPRGRTRFYRRDNADGRLEFTGENTIDHTPKNETVRIYTGDAFDIVGERKRTAFQMSARNDLAEEAFEIRVRNRKTEPVEVRVAERLYRGVNWQIIQESHPHVQTDAQNVEFRVNVPADGETVVTYRVRYTWQ